MNFERQFESTNNVVLKDIQYTVYTIIMYIMYVQSQQYKRM